jgi:hypothetical protein
MTPTIPTTDPAKMMCAHLPGKKVASVNVTVILEKNLKIYEFHRSQPSHGLRKYPLFPI